MGELRHLPNADPRVDVARRVVLRIAVFVGITLLTAAVFGLYNCATDRPAREIFFEPKPEAELEQP